MRKLLLQQSQRTLFFGVDRLQARYLVGQLVYSGFQFFLPFCLIGCQGLQPVALGLECGNLFFQLFYLAFQC